MTDAKSNDQKLASLEKAGKLLRAAKQAGEQVHADMLYDVVERAAKTIFEGDRKTLLKDDTRDALCELITTSILMASLSTAPRQGWFGKLWTEFKAKSPMTQIGVAVAAATVVGGVIYGSWVAAPGTMRSLADLMDGGPGPASVQAEEKVSPPE